MTEDNGLAGQQTSSEEVYRWSIFTWNAWRKGEEMR
jgi:hypothetical protein